MIPSVAQVCSGAPAINIGSSKKNLSIKKDMGIFGHRKFFKNIMMRSFFNAANKMTFILLPLVKQMMCLISTIQHTCLARVDDITNKGSFGPITFC